MLSLNLTPIFNARGITKPYTFLVKAGFTPHSANGIINSKTKIVPVTAEGNGKSTPIFCKTDALSS